MTHLWNRLQCKRGRSQNRAVWNWRTLRGIITNPTSNYCQCSFAWSDLNMNWCWANKCLKLSVQISLFTHHFLPEGKQTHLLWHKVAGVPSNRKRDKCLDCSISHIFDTANKYFISECSAESLTDSKYGLWLVVQYWSNSETAFGGFLSEMSVHLLTIGNPNTFKLFQVFQRWLSF